MRRGGSTIAPISSGSSTLSSAQGNGNNKQSTSTVPPQQQRPPPRRRRGNNKRLSTRTATTNAFPSWGCLMVSFVTLLVVVDLAYFYKLSSQGLLLNKGSGHQSYVIAHHKHQTSVIVHNHTDIAAQRYNNHPKSVLLNNHRGGGGHAEANDVQLIDTSASNSKDNTNHGPPPASDMLYQQAVKRGYHNLDDKKQILIILQQAQLDIDDLDQNVIDDLPTWSQIERLYGKEPKILGLETCHMFTSTIFPESERFFGVAGTFNSGTNLVAELMIKNCQIQQRMDVYGPKSRGIRWQVPWGKHYPASFRTQHLTKTDANIPVQNSLPLVAIREPYMWSQSMCKHPYECRWPTSPAHCPNIIATEEELFQYPWLASLYLDKNNNTRNEQEWLVPINIKYQDRRLVYKSLPHFWSEWYKLYVKADFPRVIVRFEDLLFHGEEVTTKLCECGGGVPRDDRPHGQFVHISESAKLGTAAHGSQKTNLLGALIKYGNLDHRLDNMTASDLAAARKYFDIHTMNFFDYHHPPE